MATRIGVDVGGTFTDLVLYDEQTRAIAIRKVPTTPEDLAQGCIRAVREAAQRDVLARTKFFIHGTTTGLNALLERREAKVGLLATSGFRDVLELRRGDRKEIYNIFWSPPPPVVPRRLRVPIRERIRATGAVDLPLVEADVADAAGRFNSRGVTAVAVAFINSYANPAHELLAETLLRQHGFKGEISLSHRVAGEYREYERTSTTIIDVLVRHRMAHYLDRLAEQLNASGFAGECLITRSGGGAMTFAEARDRSFETIMSGPVGGIEAAADWARQLGLKDVITMDVGGTSFDTAVITGGHAPLLHEGEVVGMPVLTPWIDVRSIGAGGGSIARADEGGLLRVGPESAGAAPGPACYGRGGTRPTVTDAALVLGMLGVAEFSSGLVLDIARARDAIEPLARQLGHSIADNARGIVSIATASMANAIREITVQRGQDPRSMALMAFGGAGPLLATLLARDLGITRIVIPPFPGNLSAWGLLCADIVRSTARTRVMRLCPTAIEKADEILSKLFAEITARTATNDDDATGLHEASLDLRYVGQEHYLTVNVELDGLRIANSADDIASRYQRIYHEMYGGNMDAPVEIVTVRGTRRIPLASRPKADFITKVRSNAVDAEHETYSFAKAAFLRFRTTDRRALTPGQRVLGPVIVYDPTATIYVDIGWSSECKECGSLALTLV